MVDALPKEPHVIHFGALATLYGLHPSYARYLIEQAPANLVQLAVILKVMLLTAPRVVAAEPDLEKPKPFMPVQKRLQALLARAILIWTTDLLHHISPAWVALSLASILMVTDFGMLDATEMKSKIDMSLAFFIVAAFSINEVAHLTGLSVTVAAGSMPYLGLVGIDDRYNLNAVSGVFVLLSHLTMAPAAPAVLVPLGSSMAAKTDWPVETVAIAQFIGIGTPLLPYQALPLIIAMTRGQIPAGQMAWLCIILAMAGLGLFAIYLCWSYLGMFG